MKASFVTGILGGGLDRKYILSFPLMGGMARFKVGFMANTALGKWDQRSTQQ